MKFRKCGKWIGMIAVSAVLVVGASCLTDASREDVDGEKKVETEDLQKTGTPNSSGESKYPTVASIAIDGYQLEVQCVTDDKKPKSGYYEGGSLMIQTSQDEKIIDRREVSFGKGKKVYLPAKGMELSLADYDGDGRKNDFAIGQGQGADPLLGNYMNYRFFGVDEDGAVVEYGTSTEEGVGISTVPGKYSPLYSPVFKRKNGEVIYQGLREEGVEEMSATIGWHFPVSDEKAERSDGTKINARGIQFTIPGPRTSTKVAVKQYGDDRSGYFYKQYPTKEMVHVMVSKDKKAFERDFVKTNANKEYWSYFVGNKEKLIAIDRYKDQKGKSYAVCYWKEKGVYFWVYGKWSSGDWVIFAKDAAEIASSIARAK